MQVEEVKRDIRTAKLAAWWDKWDLVVCSVGLVIFGAVLGAVCMSFYDRSERSVLIRNHDNELRDFRKMCRNNLDERDDKVKEAASAAADAARSAAEAAAAARDGLPPPPRPAAKRAPPVDLQDAVNRANAQIREGK